MKIKFASAAAAVAIAFAAQAAYADDAPAAPTPEITVTGSAAIVSQYRFRGISQSDNKPAAQMSITVSDKSGFYVSAWGSSASAGQSAVNIGGTEIDVYGGYTHALGKSGITLDAGLYGYLYPGAPASEYFELYGSLSKSYGPVGAKIGVNWAPAQSYFTNLQNVSGIHTPDYNVYEYAELTFSVPQTPVVIHGHIGHTGGGLDFGYDYIDYTLGASYKWKVLTLDASLVGTDMSHSRAVAVSNYGVGYAGVSPQEIYRAGKPVAVISLTASF